MYVCMYFCFEVLLSSPWFSVIQLGRFTYAQIFWLILKYVICTSLISISWHFINFLLQSLSSFLLIHPLSFWVFSAVFPLIFLASFLSRGQLDNTACAKNKRMRKRAGLQQHSSVIIKSHKSVMVFGYRPLDLMFFKETWKQTSNTNDTDTSLLILKALWSLKDAVP